MSADIRIAILSDNTVGARNALGEHGLAFWVETSRHRLLFDTGQGFVLAHNARALGLNLRLVDSVILSHGHYDHTGGLAGVLHATTGPVMVYAHPAALLTKYQRGETGVRDIGMSAECRDVILGGRYRFTPSSRSAEVAPGLRMTGEIPRLHPGEAITEPFCRDAAGQEADLLPDDQALFIETDRGTVVLLGCAHAGIINTLDHVQSLTDGKPIRAVLGGMHLRSATEDRLTWTKRALSRFKINCLVPMHCTGPKAAAALWTAFPLACQAGGTGAHFIF